MIRRSPSEYYLKYLISHPANYTDEQIKEQFTELGLDWLSDQYLLRVKRQTVVPVPFRPYDKEHVVSQLFLNKHRIYSLYYKDAATRGAFYILEHPKVKEFVEAMVLSGAPPVLIARGATHSVSKAPITEDAVRRFIHFFWNTDLLDFTEMRAIIAKRGNSSGDPEYKKAFYRDSRKIACDLPFNPISALISQIRMGITPAGVNFVELMEKIRTVASIKAYQCILEDNVHSSENARNFMNVATDATDLLERSANPEEKLVERINSLNLEHSTVGIPHINQLSEGNHTTDLQASETREDVVEVEDEA